MSASNEPGEGNRNTDDAIKWHPAFVEAIRLELGEYADDLDFRVEHQLTREPLRIDLVIVRKKRDVPIRKNIAQIFLGVNVIEYKGPDDYVSVRDFYKVYGYACLYASLDGKADVTDMTLTFVESHRPQSLIAHLLETRGYTVEEKWPGVYIVRGDLFPIQIIDSRRLPAGENLWLRSLSNRLDARECRRVTTELSRLGKPRNIGAYINVIVRANRKFFTEAQNMSGESLVQFMQEEGLLAKWEARVEARNEDKIFGLLRQGYTVEEVERMLAKGRELSQSGPTVSQD